MQYPKIEDKSGSTVSRSMPSVSLATTLHDSTGWTLQPLSETAKILDECYDSHLTVVTVGTKPEVVEALRETGWTIVEPRSRVGVEHITDSRRRVLRASLERGSDFTHLVDMDRALHWALSYPEELRRVAASIPGHDFMIFGRTRRRRRPSPTGCSASSWAGTWTSPPHPEALAGRQPTPSCATAGAGSSTPTQSGPPSSTA